MSDDALGQVRDQGFTIVPGFLSNEEVELARACLWHHFPTPDDYFARPSDHPRYGLSQFAGLRVFPYRGWALNRLAFHPDLVDAAERYLESDDLALYKIELWAKYAGAVDYDQPPHRDFGNHSLVVPRHDGVGAQMTSFVLLSDVTDLDAPTHVVPLDHSREVPMVPAEPEPGWEFSVASGTFDDVEVAVTGAAGTLFLYRTDVFHRGTDFAAPRRARFALLADYQVAGPRWAGKVAWPDHAMGDDFRDTMERATPRERSLFGFPAPGDPYWNAQTLIDVGERYPNMDMTPYHVAAST